MTDKFDGIQDTLYLPLVARIYVSKRFPDYFYDEKALELEQYFPYENIVEKSSEYFLMAGACRFHELDKIIKNFINNKEKANIINLGCGLETSYYRIRPDKDIRFYELDLPEVINARKKVLGKNTNEILIGQDMFDLSWTDKIDRTIPTLITAIGVFQYFDEKKIVDFIKDLSNKFDNMQLIFDAMNHKALKYANKYVEKTGNINAIMNFGVDDPMVFCEKIDIDLIDTIPFFKQARKQLGKQLKLYTRIAMKVVDEGSRKACLIYYRKR